MRWRAAATTFAIAGCVGAAKYVIREAVRYAKERHQFGKPIADFGVIKHKLADMYVAIELARSNAYYGAWALSKNAPQLPLAAATARVAANEAFFQAAKENIQVHGGMGFTWELDAHLYLKRALALDTTFGSVESAVAVMADAL